MITAVKMITVLITRQHTGRHGCHVNPENHSFGAGSAPVGYTQLDAQNHRAATVAAWEAKFRGGRLLNCLQQRPVNFHRNPSVQ